MLTFERLQVLQPDEFGEGELEGSHCDQKDEDLQKTDGSKNLCIIGTQVFHD